MLLQRLVCSSQAAPVHFQIHANELGGVTGGNWAFLEQTNVQARGQAVSDLSVFTWGLMFLFLMQRLVYSEADLMKAPLLCLTHVHKGSWLLLHCCYLLHTEK